MSFPIGKASQAQLWAADSYNNMISLPINQRRNILLSIVLLIVITLSLSLPFLAHAQAAAPAAGTPTEISQPSVCDGIVSSWTNWICYTGPIAGAIGSFLIYISILV